jgi:hypothetical protein
VPSEALFCFTEGSFFQKKCKLFIYEKSVIGLMNRVAPSRARKRNGLRSGPDDLESQGTADG